jgi:hypothetical protein
MEVYMYARKFLFALAVGLLVSGLFLAVFGQPVQAAAPGSHAAAAMNAIVTKYGSLDKVTDPGDAMTYRYLAMAAFYEKYNSMVMSALSAQKAIVARYGSLDKVTDSGDAMSYRYLAMAAFYER